MFGYGVKSEPFPIPFLPSSAKWNRNRIRTYRYHLRRLMRLCNHGEKHLGAPQRNPQTPSEEPLK